MLRFFITSLLICSVQPVSSQEDRALVHVDPYGAEASNTARRFLYAVREGIRKGGGVELADAEADADFTLHLNFMDPMKRESSNGTVVFGSTVTFWTYLGRDMPIEMFMGSSIGVCYVGEEMKCAANVLAELDEKVTGMRRVVAEAGRPWRNRAKRGG